MARHSRKCDLHYQKPKKHLLQIKLLEFASTCNLSRQHLYRVLIKAHATQGYFFSIFSLVDDLNLNLPGKSFSKQVLEYLKKHLPKCEPYVLTHCDLNLGNIMVKDGELVGILGWEYAAYYPIWYEYVSASWGFTDGC